jgi:hypothetical protein
VRIAQWLPWVRTNAQIYHGYVFGQNMYTPSDPEFDSQDGEQFGAMSLSVAF